ncbi:DUF4260 family protein [Amycolatopsis endophytica]|uniref:DUF4260 domain-containing protein n=1 Tax=Amycolatopsis endophytica TaxID=860233 RepID=A0A853AVU5_9PSEU|nr:DUF4260 family protein [Amycolatopsis endophytica]NYI86731.1 hypothetical protein [Amycolatopsis endophytica]
MTRVAWALVAAFLLAFAVFEAVKHGGWTVGALVLGLIGPDLTFLAGIGAGPIERGVLPRRVVPFYNAAHHWAPPVVLLVVFSFVASPAAFTLGLAWLAHIAVDRVFGYGLRTAEGRQRAAA